MTENAPTPATSANGPQQGQPGEQGGGGNDSTPPQPAQQQGGQGQQGEPAPAAAAQPQSPEPSEQQGEQSLENASHADLVSQIRELRRENAKDRTSAKETAADEARNDVVQSIGKALGLVKDGDDTPDAEQLTQQLTEQTQAAKQAQLELSVYRAASKHGADADALLDSRSFLEKVADIDPSKTADLDAAIKETVETNPRLQASQQTPGRSSSPLNQHRGSDGKGTGSKTPEELAAAVTKQNPY